MKVTRVVSAPLLVAMALAGCKSVPPKTLEGDTSEKVIVRERGIDQVRDEDSGERYFVVCEDCARPTLKTRYRPPTPVVIARIDPAPTAQADVMPAPPAETPPPILDQPQNQAAAYKRLVPFGFGRDRLGPLGREAMAALIEEAKAAERIHVRGYTDIIGRMPGNKRLAMARSEAIRAYLVKSGVSPEKISVSHCIDCFIESNESEPGRAANRRAVVVIRPSIDAVDTIGLDRRDPCRAGVVMEPLNPTQTPVR